MFFVIKSKSRKKSGVMKSSRLLVQQSMIKKLKKCLNKKMKLYFYC